MTENSSISTEFRNANASPVEARGAQPLDFDPGRYRADLAGLDLTEQQQTALLGALWSIMQSFVEMGLDVKNCGQVFAAFNEASGVDSADDTLDVSAKTEIKRGRGFEHGG